MTPERNGSYYPCPSCGTLNSIIRTYCRKCRKPL